MNQLAIDQLTAEIEDKTILNGVTLTIKSGETHALMGPNGSGKSTLAALLLGRPDIKIKFGSIKLNETDLAALPPNERGAAGLFLGFQYPVALPGVSIGQLLRASLKGAVNLTDLRREVLSKMKELGLPDDFLERSVNDGFSGGEKKRCEILQMSVLKPKIAVLDEADSGVDVDAVQTIARRLKKIQEETGCGLLLITHYRQLLRYLEPDFVHVMSGGRIVESGDKTLAAKIERGGYKQYENKN